MKILITGGTGFVGSRLSRLLLDRGHAVTAVGTRKTQNRVSHERFRYLPADATSKGSWTEAVREADAVINLAGKSIFKRWTEDYKRRIYDSRILTTRNLVDSLPQKEGLVFLSASAVGYYGDREDEVLTEDSSPGEDFLARVGRDWEAEALRAGEKGARVVIARFGIVLGRGGGALEKMVPPFRFFMGGPLGDGKQWFPWIHMGDLLAALEFGLGNVHVRGPVNFCAPHPVRNRDLAQALGKTLNRPARISTPAIMIRIMMGEMGETLLNSDRAVPEKLLAMGFGFRYPRIREALEDLLGNR